MSRRSIFWALRLYPTAWRKRYGAEFAALLEDVGPGWRDWWDIARGGLKMRLRWNLATVTVSCALLGAAVAAGLALRAPDEYVSTAVLRVGAPVGAWSLNFGEHLQQAQTIVLSRTSLAEILVSEDLYREKRRVAPMEDVVRDMRDRAIRIAPLSERNGAAPRAFAISFSYPDRRKAQRVTGRLVAAFTERVTRSGVFAAIEVLDPPTLPERPASPNRTAYTAAGLGAGLVVGLLLFGVRRWPVVAAAGATAGALACGGSFLIADRWVSAAVVRIEPARASATVASALTEERLAEIIRKPSLNLYAKERASMPIGTVVERMRKDMRIAAAPGGIGPSVVIGDRFKAQAVVRELVTLITETNFMDAKKHAADPHFPPALFETLRVVSPPPLPERPAGPNRLVIVVLGLGAGLALGAVATARRRPKAMTAGAA